LYFCELIIKNNIMKKITLFALAFLCVFQMNAQISPTTSMYYANGPMAIVSDSDMTAISKPLLFYRPATTSGAPYPVFMFQLGANGFLSSAINRHSYDIYMQHLASHGYVVIVIDDSQAGLPSGTTFKAAHTWFKDKVANTSHWLNSYADPNKLAIGGHSNGGVNAAGLLVDRPTEIHGIVFFASYPSSTFPVVQDVSGYTGKVLSLAGDEDTQSTPSACKGGFDKFTSASCKTYVLVSGLAHGGFGDYDLSSQPVGSIGRDNATATVRHYLVSFMKSQFKGDGIALANMTTSLLQPNTTGEFETNCTGSVNIEEFLEETFLFYPNPVKNDLHISLSGKSIEKLEVIDVLGRTHRIVENASGNLVIDFSDLPKGVYSIRMLSNHQYIVRSVLKK